MIKLICKNCKNIFKVDPYRKDNAKFCSSKCYGLAMKNRIISPMQYWLGKKRATKYWLGKKRPDMENNKFAKGNIPWCKGIPNKFVTNEKNTNWKGDYVGYEALHEWISRRLGRPNYCVLCRTTVAKRFEWANVSRLYKRNVDDFIRLCKSCHQKVDKNKIELIVQTV